MNTTNDDRLLLELRFWDRDVTEGILDCLARDFAVRTVDRRSVDTESWVRLEVDGDARKADRLGALGRKLGFAVRKVA